MDETPDLSLEPIEVLCGSGAIPAYIATPVEVLEEKELRRIISTAVRKLKTRRERVALYYYFRKDESLKKVGSRFNIGPERMRQVIKKSLKKLRHPSICRDLRDYFEIRTEIRSVPEPPPETQEFSRGIVCYISYIKIRGSNLYWKTAHYG